MTDSPKSELFPSRFLTPVEDLDDHRFQSESLPRADTMSGQRRPTLVNTSDQRPPLLQVTDYHQGTTSRDFEQAVIDDDPRDGVSAKDDHIRRGSTSPIAARRGPFRRSRGQDDGQDRSRESSPSSRSASPPNSVDAFAEPKRRPRAGTVATLNSLAPSIDMQRLNRSSSNRTFNRSRTFSDDRGKGPKDESESDHGSVEDDICFPAPEDPSNQSAIDFEDLEEFVDQQRNAAPAPTRSSRKASFSCQGAMSKAFTNVNDHHKHEVAQATDKTPPTSKDDEERGVDSDDSVSVMNEKMERLTADMHLPERQSRWSFFSSELEQSVHASNLGDLLMPGESFKHLFELGPDGGCWWLDITMPTEDEVEVICKAFGIHGLTREDIIQQETREKVELFRSYYFVSFRSFYQNSDSEHFLEPINVYAVVFREGIVTFTFVPSPHAANVRKRMGRLRDYVALGSDWICYALIDDIVDTFGPVIHGVEVETDAIEDSVFTARSEDSRAILKQIGDSRKKVMTLIRLIGGKADVIKGFAKRCNEQYTIAPRQDVGLYLSDIQDHVVTMMSNLGHFEKMLSRSHSNYLAQISVDSIESGNRVNEVLSKVTFIATILVPLNLVCGLFGMNVPIPGQHADSLGPFFGILGGIVTLVLVGFTIAKKWRLL